ncbi:MAG TPA: hypothetical protein VII08_15000 [Myxococcales bacterium]
MNIRTILVGAGVLALGGYALYDYNSPESKLARELKEIEQLEPDIKPPECFPKGQNAKLFAAAIQRDRRPRRELTDEVTRRSAITHDCIRGNDPKTVARVVKALGPAGVPVYAEVLEKCPVVKDEYPVYACFALDALHFEGGKDASAALEKALTNKDKGRKNVYLGALYRLMNTTGWKTNAQLAQMIPVEPVWEAKQLLIEHIRHHKDPSARPDLDKAYSLEQEQQEKGLIRAALLEIDNPGKCVVSDEGRAETGLCRYTCTEINRWFSLPKPKTGCALATDPPAETQQGEPAQSPPVNSAGAMSPAAASAKRK